MVVSASHSYSSATTSASSSRLLSASVSNTYSEISAGSASAKVFPFHQLEPTSKKYDGIPSTNKLHPNATNPGMVGEGSGSVEITSSGMNRYSPDSTDCTISGVTKRVPLTSDLHAQQRHLQQAYHDQQQLSAHMYAGMSVEKLQNSGNSKTGYKTLPMSPYHQQQLYMPTVLQKMSPADGQKKSSQMVGSNGMSGPTKSGSLLSDQQSNKGYLSAYQYQQQQRHMLMASNKYDGAAPASVNASVGSGQHHITSPSSSYQSSVSANTSSSSSVSVQNTQKQKHYQNISIKSLSRSSVELLKISNDSNDEVKIIGSTPAPGSSTSTSSNNSSRPVKEVPVINIISDGHESPSPGRGPVTSAAVSGPAMTNRGVHSTSDYQQQGSEDGKRFNTPLSINIPIEALSESSASGTSASGSGKPETVSGKSSLGESRDPKLGSRKHIIMNAVNQDEALKKVFHVENGSGGVSLNPHEESISETSYNSISPAPSPKMPILSPQHKNPPRMGSPSTNDPPPLEPSPATFLENPSPVSFVQENLANNDQIVRPNLEIKRAPTNVALQRPKPPIPYIQDPMYHGQFSSSSVFGQHIPYHSAFNAPMHPYMHMMPASEHGVHSASSSAAAAARLPEVNPNSGTGIPSAGMAGANSGMVMDSIRDKRDGFNVRTTARNKNIPVANVAPIVQAKYYRQNGTMTSSSSSLNMSSAVGPNMSLPSNPTNNNSNSNSSDEVKIISASNDGPCRPGGIGEKTKSKSDKNVTGTGGGGDVRGSGGGLKDASGKVSPTIPRTFFSPHNIISMFKSSKNEKILESMCCDKSAQRGKMSLKDAINTLLEKHCKELHVETDQGEGSPSCLSSSSRSSDVEIIENPFERDDDPVITDTTSSTIVSNANYNQSAGGNQHHLLQRHSSTTTNTTTTITTTITNTTTFGTIVSSAINSATLSDDNNERIRGSSISSKSQRKQMQPYESSQLLAKTKDDDDEDVIALPDEPDPNYKSTNNITNNSENATNGNTSLNSAQNDAYMNRLKQKLLRSVPVDLMTSANGTPTGYKPYSNTKNIDENSGVPGVISTGGKNRDGCDYIDDDDNDDEHPSEESEKADETEVVKLRESTATTKTLTDTMERQADADGESLCSQRSQNGQEKSFTSENNNIDENQKKIEEDLENVFNRTKEKDACLSEKPKTSGRRVADELKRKAVMRAVVYRKTLYQEFNERIRIGRAHKDGDNRMIMTRSSTRQRGSQRTRCRSSLRPRAARPQRGALAEKDSEEEESLPGCWEIERSSPSLRLRRRRIGAMTPSNNSSISVSNTNETPSESSNNNATNSNATTTSTNANTTANKKRLMMTLHWRPRRSSQIFGVAGRRKYRVMTRYTPRNRRNVFGGQLPHNYNRQTLDWSEVRQLPVPGSSTSTAMRDPYEMCDDETESVTSNSNSVGGSNPIPPEIRRITINKNSGETLLHRSARCGYEDVLLHCLETKTVEVNARDNAGFTPLHECCVRGNILIARYLITYGADVNQCSQDGIRPIHDAVENDHIEMARLLLSFGADPLLTTYSGKSPLKIARSSRMINLLKDHIGDLNGDDNHEIAPWEFHGSWDLKETDAKSGNPIFHDVPSDPETDESDTEDFVFDDCPLPAFSLQSNIDKKYLSVLDIAQNKGEKVDKIREVCQAKISTIKIDDFMNETQGLICLQSTMSRIKAEQSDFVELIEVDDYVSIISPGSARRRSNPGQPSSHSNLLTNTDINVCISKSKDIDEYHKTTNGHDGALETLIPLTPNILSDEEAPDALEIKPSYFEVTSNVSSLPTKENSPSSTHIVQRTDSTPKDSNSTKLHDATDHCQEAVAETSVPALPFNGKSAGGPTKAAKKKRPTMDNVFPGTKSTETATSCSTATSVRHNGHFTIKVGSISEDGFQTFGIDQARGVNDHGVKGQRKLTNDPPPSYTDNLEYTKQNTISTESSVVIDR